MATEHPIILHHFPQSPFSEKIRLIFGLKKIAWTSVVITRIMPRPDLMPMTGGYRRTPVMQIGADIYCDTQCIIRELERRFPEPTLFPEAMPGSCLRDGDVDRQGVLSEHREPRLRLARRQGPAGIHRRPRETARRQIRRRRDDGRDPANARPVSRPSAMDRRAARRRPELDVRGPGQPVRYQRLHERLVCSHQSSRSSTRCSRNFRPRETGKRGCARSGTALPPKCRRRRHWRSARARRQDRRARRSP